MRSGRLAAKILCAAAVAAVSLTACGGSSTAPSAQTIVVKVPATTASSPPATLTSATTASSATKAARPRPAKRAPVRKKTATVRLHSSGKPPLTDASITKNVSGPSAASCMQSAGLIAITSPSPGEWKSTDGLDGPAVFVDGPFSSSGAARASTASYQGIEEAAQGGLYVVTALLVSHLGPVVQRVARCLVASRGHGGLQY